MEKTGPTIIARTWMASEASVIKSLLESYNIPCHYSSKLTNTIYPISVDGLGEIRIFVPASLAEEARTVLEQHRRTNGNLRLVEDDELVS